MLDKGYVVLGFIATVFILINMIIRFIKYEDSKSKVKTVELIGYFISFIYTINSWWEFII